MGVIAGIGWWSAGMVDASDARVSAMRDARDKDDALQIALRLKALAEPVRVKIVSYLFSSLTGEEISGDLAAVLNLTESTVSHHLTQLRKAGLVVSERRGTNMFHRVRPDALHALCAALDPSCCT